MFSIYFPPRPSLAEFVDCICIMGHDFSCSDNLSPFYTYMPTHTRLLCFYLEDSVKVKKGDGEFENHGRAVIIGPQLTPVTLDLGKKHSNLLVLFKPCGLYRLLGIPLCQMLDCDFDAQLIIGKEITEITERLMEAKSCDAKNGIIQLYLLSKLNEYQPPLPIDLAMSQMVSSCGKMSMDLLAAKSCLSVRQLERQSLQRIGLPPKYFARMVRFSVAYKFKESNPKASWTEIAHQFGYYDQMHLIRDFQHFTGINPSDLKEEAIVHSVRFNSKVP